MENKKREPKGKRRRRGRKTNQEKAKEFLMRLDKMDFGKKRKAKERAKRRIRGELSERKQAGEVEDRRARGRGRGKARCRGRGRRGRKKAGRVAGDHESFNQDPEEALEASFAVQGDETNVSQSLLRVDFKIVEREERTEIATQALQRKQNKSQKLSNETDKSKKSKKQRKKRQKKIHAIDTDSGEEYDQQEDEQTELNQGNLKKKAPQPKKRKPGRPRKVQTRGPSDSEYREDDSQSEPEQPPKLGKRRKVGRPRKSKRVRKDRRNESKSRSRSRAKTKTKTKTSRSNSRKNTKKVNRKRKRKLKQFKSESEESEYEEPKQKRKRGRKRVKTEQRRETEEEGTDKSQQEWQDSDRRIEEEEDSQRQKPARTKKRKRGRPRKKLDKKTSKAKSRSKTRSQSRSKKSRKVSKKKTESKNSRKKRNTRKARNKTVNYSDSEENLQIGGLVETEQEDCSASHSVDLEEEVQNSRKPENKSTKLRKDRKRKRNKEKEREREEEREEDAEREQESSSEGENEPLQEEESGHQDSQKSGSEDGDASDIGRDSKIQIEESAIHNEHEENMSASKADENLPSEGSNELDNQNILEGLSEESEIQDQKLPKRPQTHKSTNNRHDTANETKNSLNHDQTEPSSENESKSDLCADSKGQIEGEEVSQGDPSGQPNLEDSHAKSEQQTSQILKYLDKDEENQEQLSGTENILEELEEEKRQRPDSGSDEDSENEKNQIKKKGKAVGYSNDTIEKNMKPACPEDDSTKDDQEELNVESNQINRDSDQKLLAGQMDQPTENQRKAQEDEDLENLKYSKMTTRKKLDLEPLEQDDSEARTLGKRKRLRKGFGAFDRLLDEEVVDCDSCIEEEVQVQAKSNHASRGGDLSGRGSDLALRNGHLRLENQDLKDEPVLRSTQSNGKSQVRPNWEYLNMSFQKADVMEGVYRKIKNQSLLANRQVTTPHKLCIENGEILKKLREDRTIHTRREMFDQLIGGITDMLDRVKQEKKHFEQKTLAQTRNHSIDQQHMESETVIQNLRDQFEKRFEKSKNLFNTPESSQHNGIKIETSKILEKNEHPQMANTMTSTKIHSNSNPKNMTNSECDKPKILKSYSFLNCDVNYFNFEYLSQQVGGFDIILMDPPWRIKGGQKNDSQFMFANNRFCLEYDTMSNEQIASLNIGSLSEKGFMFLWILGNQIKSACAMLSKWGYDLVDLIVWVKTKNGRVYLSHGYYLMHSFEICLVGYKCPSRKRVEYFSKVSNNIIFAEVRSKSQKPEALYEIIELMMPGAKRLEIFARNNNLRRGWFSIGNQLGEEFCKWNNHVSCDGCSFTIGIGTARFKSRLRSNFDLCLGCYSKLISKDGSLGRVCQNGGGNGSKLTNGVKQKTQEQIVLEEGPSTLGTLDRAQDCQMVLVSATPHVIHLQRKMASGITKTLATQDNLKMRNRVETGPGDFFRIENKVNEAVLHKYYSCDGCQMSPIWGLRFSCNNCPNLDLCEGCYDLCQETGPRSQALLSTLKFHSPSHTCKIHELQELSYGYQTHLGERCASCYQKPIIGVCFKCKKCTNLSMCQKCFFQDRGLEVPHRKSHMAEHSWDMVIRSQKRGMKNRDCSWCELSDAKAQYECDICHEFYLCSVCYMKRDYFVTNKASTHKVFHTFSKITDGYVYVAKK